MQLRHACPKKGQHHGHACPKKGPTQHGTSQLLPPAPPYYPFPEENSILGVIYGVLRWADMNAATPLGARGRSVISLAPKRALIKKKKHID